MIRTGICIAVSAMLTVAILGCDKINSEKVIGLWRSEQDHGGLHTYIELAKDKLIVDGADSLDIALEDKDDKVTVRRAGTDEVVGVITVVDDNIIEFEQYGFFGGKKERFVRSTPKEMADEFNPPVDRIVGFWRGETEGAASGLHAIMEITPQSVVIGETIIPAEIGNVKGGYSIKLKDRMLQGKATLRDEKLHCDFIPGARSFVRVDADEAKTLIAETKATQERETGKYLGFWVQEEVRPGFKMEYLEVARDSLDQNGDEQPVTTSLTPEGLVVTQENGTPVMTLILEGGTLRSKSAGFTFGISNNTYVRSTPEELEKHNIPKLEDYIGFWELDPSTPGSFGIMEIGSEHATRDRRKEPMAMTHSEPGYAVLSRPIPMELRMFAINRIDDDRIRITNDRGSENAYIYNRIDRARYAAAAESTSNPLAFVPGFWRSAEPVEDTRGEKVAYATVAFALGVQGSMGKVVDWTNYSFISNSTRNRSIGDTGNVREGVFVFRDGQVDGLIELIREDTRGSAIQVRVVDKDTLDVAVDGRNFVRCVRTTREEMMKARATTKQ